MNEIDTLINYAIKNGYIDDSASEWSKEEKQHYVNMCNMMENEGI